MRKLNREKDEVLKSFIQGIAVVCAGVSGVAQAEIVDEIRFGILDHNVRVLTPKNSNKEPGINVSAEIRFKKLELLGDTWSPHPYAMISKNTDGATSYAAVGVEWDFEFVEGWHFQPGIGYALHDGEISSTGVTADVRAEFEATHLQLGSLDLFRTSIAITKDINERWGIQLIYDHLSHGQVLGSGRNQGLDDVGLRAVYSF